MKKKIPPTNLQMDYQFGKAGSQKQNQTKTFNRYASTELCFHYLSYSSSDKVVNSSFFNKDRKTSTISLDRRIMWDNHRPQDSTSHRIDISQRIAISHRIAIAHKIDISHKKTTSFRPGSSHKIATSHRIAGSHKIASSHKIIRSHRIASYHRIAG